MISKKTLLPNLETTFTPMIAQIKNLIWEIPSTQSNKIFLSHEMLRLSIDQILKEVDMMKTRKID